MTTAIQTDAPKTSVAIAEQQTLSTPWHQSITVRLLLLLLGLFALIATVAYLVIEQQGRPKIIEVTDEVIIQTGNEAVNGIISRIQLVDGMALSASEMVSNMPHNEAMLKNTFASVMNIADERVVSGC